MKLNANVSPQTFFLINALIWRLGLHEIGFDLKINLISSPMTYDDFLAFTAPIATSTPANNGKFSFNAPA